MEQGLILIYTGHGKGKTSASLGQCIRAHGQGMRVLFVQFMKRDVQAGEQVILQSLLKQDFYVGGCGFFRHEKERQEHAFAAEKTLDFAVQALQKSKTHHEKPFNMVVLDEILYALDSKLVSAENLQNFLDLAADQAVHVVLSGRNAPAWLVEKAHLVTEMQEVKHPWKMGIKAQKGIEF